MNTIEKTKHPPSGRTRAATTPCNPVLAGHSGFNSAPTPRVTPTFVHAVGRWPYYARGLGGDISATRTGGGIECGLIVGSSCAGRPGRGRSTKPAAAPDTLISAGLVVFRRRGSLGVDEVWLLVGDEEPIFADDENLITALRAAWR